MLSQHSNKTKVIVTLQTKLLFCSSFLSIYTNNQLKESLHKHLSPLILNFSSFISVITNKISFYGDLDFLMGRALGSSTISGSCQIHGTWPSNPKKPIEESGHPRSRNPKNQSSFWVMWKSSTTKVPNCVSWGSSKYTFYTFCCFRKDHFCNIYSSDQTVMTFQEFPLTCFLCFHKQKNCFQMQRMHFLQRSNYGNISLADTNNSVDNIVGSHFSLTPSHECWVKLQLHLFILTKCSPANIWSWSAQLSAGNDSFCCDKDGKWTSSSGINKS